MLTCVDIQLLKVKQKTLLMVSVAIASEWNKSRTFSNKSKQVLLLLKRSKGNLLYSKLHKTVFPIFRGIGTEGIYWEGSQEIILALIVFLKKKHIRRKNYQYRVYQQNSIRSRIESARTTKRNSIRKSEFIVGNDFQED